MKSIFENYSLGFVDIIEDFEFKRGKIIRLT